MTKDDDRDRGKEGRKPTDTQYCKGTISLLELFFLCGLPTTTSDENAERRKKADDKEIFFHAAQSRAQPRLALALLAFVLGSDAGGRRLRPRYFTTLRLGLYGKLARHNSHHICWKRVDVFALLLFLSLSLDDDEATTTKRGSRPAEQRTTLACQATKQQQEKRTALLPSHLLDLVYIHITDRVEEGT